MKLKQLKGPVCLFFAFSLAGTSVIAARLISGRLGTFTIAAVSLFFALLVLLPVCGKRLVREIRSMSAKDFIFLAVQAVFGIFLFRMFLLNGLLHTGAVEAGILTGATPAITALLAAVFLKEAVNKTKLIGIGGTVAGVLMIQGLLAAGNEFRIEHLLGNLLVLCAAACESTFNIFSRKFSVKAASGSKEQVSPIVQTTIVSEIALALCAIPALFETPVQRLSEIGTGEWLSLLWYGIFVTALAFICWYAGIKRCGAFTAAAFSGMMPFTSMLLSVLILKEQAGWQQWMGGALVITGMILIGSGKGTTKNSE